MAGQLGATYATDHLRAVLMITHVVAFYLLLRPQPKAVRALAAMRSILESRVCDQKQLKLEGESESGQEPCEEI